MSNIYNAPHPGATLREDVLPALEITVAEAARQLGVSRVTFLRVLHERAAIAVELARRLEVWLGGPDHGPSADVWLRGQISYDLWQAHLGAPPRVTPAHTRAN